MQRFAGAAKFRLADEFYDLSYDPDERTNLAADAARAGDAADLRSRIEAFLLTHSDPKFDLWRGGSGTSNVTYPALWRQAWGDGWAPIL